MKTAKRLFVTMFALMFVIAFLPSRYANAQQTLDQGKTREFKYEAGSFPLRRETKTKVTVGRDQIVCQPEGGQRFTIPIQSINEVAYDTKAQRRTAEAAALAAFSPLGGLILFSMKKTKHYVSIVWEENGEKKDVVFMVSKDDRTPFLNELQSVTDKPWRDLDSEQKKTLQELKVAKENAVSLQLDRTTQVGNVALKPGVYQIVLLDRGNGVGDLHFFEGKKVKPEKSLVSMKVEIVNQSNSVATGAQISYKEENGKALISEIQTPTRAFKMTN